MTLPRRSRWPMQGAALAATFAMVGPVVAGPQAEQAASGLQPTIKELMRRLEERDALSADLQQRVVDLERQRATAADRAPPANQQPMATKSVSSVPPVTSSAEQEPWIQAEEAPPVASGAAPPVPGQFEVDKEAADRALERTLVVTGALLLPFGQADIESSFTYIRSQEEAPTFFFEQGRRFIGSQDVRRDTFIGDLFLRFGLPFDSQLEVGIPYRYVQQSVVTEVGFGARAETESDGSGFGDPSFGLAKGLLHERNWWPDLVGRVTWDTGLGETSDGGVALGGGFNELQGSVTMTKRQDPLVFTGGASYGTTFEKDDINPGDQLGFSVGALLAASPETSLRVVLDQAFVNELEVGGRAISGTDQVIGALNFGASSIIGRGKFLDLTAGVGLTDESPDYSVGISIAIGFDAPTRF